MNISRRYSISVWFVYGLKEKDSKSEVLFAVCRLPLTSCVTSLIMTNDLLQESIHRKETKTWQHVYSTLVTNIHNERKTFFQPS